jgi:hypothetical protein
VHHASLLSTVDAETMKRGRTPKRGGPKKALLRVVAEPTPESEVTMTKTLVAAADPSVVRPSLALAAAETLEQLKTSLLEAAGSAAKPVWLTVECSGCGERSQVEAPIPDVRTRVAAIELLLREGLGRPATAEEVRAPRMPANVAAVRSMEWEDMQALFAATYVDEIAAVQRHGGRGLVLEKLAVLSTVQRQILREALDELELVPAAT